MNTPTVYVICDQNCKFEGLTREQILTAITQAVNEGTIGDIDTGFITTIKTINGTPLKFFVGEQADYDALTDEQKQNLFAIITNDTTKDGILNAIKTLQEDLESLAKRVTECEKHALSYACEKADGETDFIINLNKLENKAIYLVELVFSSGTDIVYSNTGIMIFTIYDATYKCNTCRCDLGGGYKLDISYQPDINTSPIGKIVVISSNDYFKLAGTLNFYKIATI